MTEDKVKRILYQLVEDPVNPEIITSLLKEYIYMNLIGNSLPEKKYYIQMWKNSEGTFHFERNLLKFYRYAAISSPNIYKDDYRVIDKSGFSLYYLKVYNPVKIDERGYLGTVLISGNLVNLLIATECLLTEEMIEGQ